MPLIRHCYTNGSNAAKLLNADAFNNLFQGTDCILRPSCFSCHYAGKKRTEDITIADFWGIEDKHADMFNDNKDPGVIVKEKGLVQISDEGAIIKVCQEAIDENAKIVADYKSGKKSAIGALVGAVMKKSKGKANPQMVNKTLTELLSK